jgi:hypothetical protein
MLDDSQLYCLVMIRSALLSGEMSAHLFQHVWIVSTFNTLMIFLSPFVHFTESGTATDTKSGMEETKELLMLRHWRAVDDLSGLDRAPLVSLNPNAQRKENRSNNQSLPIS